MLAPVIDSAIRSKYGFAFSDRADRRRRLERTWLVKRLFLAPLVVLVLAPTSGATTAHHARLMLGRSERGRPIVAIHAGDPRGTTVLVIGCIHGSECAGIAIAHALERVRTRLDLWVVPNLNPDGYALGRRR